MAWNERYGKAANLEDFLRKSQAMNYEAQRAMFEAYGRNKYESTGVIQWMLNNAWPSIIWNLYDYYLVPCGAYFGSKKACEPLHVQYSYDDDSVAVVNGYDHAFPGTRVKATIYDINAETKSRQDVTLDIPADSSVRALQFARSNGIVSDLLSEAGIAGRFRQTGERQFLLALDQARRAGLGEESGDGLHAGKRLCRPERINSLAPGELAIRSSISQEGKEKVVHAFVENPSSSLAFMVHLRVAKSEGDEDVVPIFWDDNYVSLMPGEKRELSARFDSGKNNGDGLVLAVDGWNVVAASSSIAAEGKR